MRVVQKANYIFLFFVFLFFVGDPKKYKVTSGRHELYSLLLGSQEGLEILSASVQKRNVGM